MSATVPPSSKVTAVNRAVYLSGKFDEVRRATERLCVNLEPEDYVIQSMPDCSPTKWHLAHTTWFFETFILFEAVPDYSHFNPHFSYLFNSYYVQAGERWARPHRGMISRPTVAEIYDYRHHVEAAMQDFLDTGITAYTEEKAEALLDRVEIGLQHEQQHQELLVTDIKHLFSLNPLRPVLYPEVLRAPGPDPGPPEWIRFDESLRHVGFEGEGFHFDNEKPRHHQYVPAFELATRTVSNGEYMEFINDDGYRRPELWLSLGWEAVERNQWHAPLYWERHPDVASDAWQVFTTAGMKLVDPAEPVTHISFYEADAYARWAGYDLPTEAMWESACEHLVCKPEEGHFVEDGSIHPLPVMSRGGIHQMFGNVWEWTSSPYIAYPGYKPVPGALGEYNGKFMSNQMVLRGGSCATPRSHIRASYRNFFPPEARWQFSGLRLAKIAEL